MGKPKSPRRVADNEALSVGTQIRGSAQKLNLVAALIRGRKVEDAMNILTFSKKAITSGIAKCFSSSEFRINPAIFCFSSEEIVPSAEATRAQEATVASMKARFLNFDTSAVRRARTSFPLSFIQFNMTLSSDYRFRDADKILHGDLQEAMADRVHQCGSEHSGADVLIVDPELDESLKSVTTKHRFVIGEESDSILYRYGVEPRPWAPDEDATATVNYTSGTSVTECWNK